MEQIKLFIEKAQSDNELMAKLDELGAKNAEPEEIVTLAAEYGFAVTKEDVEQAMNKTTPIGVLSEEELDAVSGGKDIPGEHEKPDRWDSAACMAHGRTRYECVGFLGAVWCKHYHREQRGLSNNVFMHYCAKKAWKEYQGLRCGEPLVGHYG